MTIPQKINAKNRMQDVINTYDKLRNKVTLLEELADAKATFKIQKAQKQDKNPFDAFYEIYEVKFEVLTDQAADQTIRKSAAFDLFGRQNIFNFRFRVNPLNIFELKHDPVLELPEQKKLVWKFVPYKGMRSLLQMNDISNLSQIYFYYGQTQKYYFFNSAAEALDEQ